MATSLKQIGSKLVELCKQGKNLEAIDSLYSKDIVSVEACDMPGFERTQKGIDKIKGKNQWWFENHTIHSGDVKGPFLHGDDRFAVIFTSDITAKSGPMAGQRMRLEEVGLYTVRDDKIVKEEFYYTMD